MISENISHCCFSLHLVTGECKLVSLLLIMLYFFPEELLPHLCVCWEGKVHCFYWFFYCGVHLLLIYRVIFDLGDFAETSSCGQWIFLFWPAKNYFCYFTNTLQLLHPTGMPDTPVVSTLCFIFSFYIQNQSLRFFVTRFGLISHHLNQLSSEGLTSSSVCVYFV